MSYLLYVEYQTGTSIVFYLFITTLLTCAMCRWNWKILMVKRKNQYAISAGSFQQNVCRVSNINNSQLLLFTSIDFNFSAAITYLPTHLKSMSYLLIYSYLIYAYFVLFFVFTFRSVAPCSEVTEQRIRY